MRVKIIVIEVAPPPREKGRKVGKVFLEGKNEDRCFSCLFGPRESLALLEKSSFVREMLGERRIKR